jgi:predicted ArsR family transcriptional regulator
MKPPVTVSPEEAVPSPTVPDKERKQLLALAAKGVTTDDAAKELGLLRSAVWRYLELLRVAGEVALRPTENGRGAEWCRSNSRSKRST